MSLRGRIEFHVQPRASKTQVAGLHDGRVRVRLAAPPVDDAANEALVAFVAQRLGVPKRQVQIVGGRTSRRRVLEIEGVTSERALTALLTSSAD